MAPTAKNRGSEKKLGHLPSKAWPTQGDRHGVERAVSDPGLGHDRLDHRHQTFDYLNQIGACLVGDPVRCIEIAKRYKAAGCELLLCLVQPYKIPHEKVMKSIELLGKHVMPALT